MRNSEPHHNSTTCLNVYGMPPFLENKGPPIQTVYLTIPSDPQRETVIAQLSRTLDSEPTPSALKSTNLSRHREILAEHRTTLTRLTSSIKTARDRANLLSNIRSDISSGAHQPDAEADYMLDERRRIDESHSMVDGVLAQAYAVNESFASQREMLGSVQRRIAGVVGRVPGINEVMGRISRKRRRDGFILSGFIAFCFIFFWFLS